MYATDSSGGNFGGIGCYSISMSSDGNTLAIGTLFNAIRVFSYDSNTDIWIQKGADIVNTSTVNRYGYSTQLSSDGNIIAIGIPDSPFVPEAGITQIYQYNTGAWSQIANNIVGLSPAENSGRSVDLSSDGNTVAILSDNTLRVYQNVSGNWTLYGNEIPATGSQTTNSAISLSSNGTILALGEPDYTGNFIQQDRVRIFKYRAGLWEQIGDDIIGEVTQYRTGWSVSLSEGGDFIAIGEPGSTSSTTDTGRMRFFKNQNDSWIQVGNSIFGEASEDYSGRSVALSFDAGTVIIGAPKNDDGADNAGHARVYNLNDLLSVIDITKPKVGIFPNPSSNEFTVQLTGDIRLNKVTIFNSDGQLMKSTTLPSVSVSDLSADVYILKIYTSNGLDTEKIIVK